MHSATFHSSANHVKAPKVLTPSVSHLGDAIVASFPPRKISPKLANSTLQKRLDNNEPEREVIQIISSTIEETYKHFGYFQQLFKESGNGLQNAWM